MFTRALSFVALLCWCVLFANRVLADPEPWPRDDQPAASGWVKPRPTTIERSDAGGEEPQTVSPVEEGFLRPRRRAAVHPFHRLAQTPQTTPPSGETAEPVEEWKPPKPVHGDVFRSSRVIFDILTLGGGEVTAELPTPGGRRIKIAEYNQALVQDRIFFVVNHFDEALDRTAPTGSRSLSVTSYTFGWEAAISTCTSIDMRLPLMSHFQDTEGAYSAAGGGIGNLALATKHLFSQSLTCAWSAGVGLSLPTGDDVTATIGPPAIIGAQRTLIIENKAVHLLPYVALTSVPGGCFFYHAFAQLDFDVNGNEIRDQPTGGGAGSTARLREATLLYADLSLGFWIWRQDPCRPCNPVSGIALMPELHYNRSVERDNAVTFGAGGPTATVASQDVDVLNFTAGVHIEILNQAGLRFAGVFPVSGSDDKRFFDFELIVGVEGRF